MESKSLLPLVFLLAIFLFSSKQSMIEGAPCESAKVGCYCCINNSDCKTRVCEPLGYMFGFFADQSKVSALTWIALASQTLLCWLFDYVFGWGTTGAAVAFDLTSWVSQFVYVVGWCGDGWTAFREIWAFVRLSFESAIMMCLEIWYMMSIIILTGHLDNAVTAVGHYKKQRNQHISHIY